VAVNFNLLVEETVVLWENPRHAASHRQILLHKLFNVVSSTPRHEQDSIHTFSGKFSNNCQIKIFDHCYHKFSL